MGCLKEEIVCCLGQYWFRESVVNSQCLLTVITVLVEALFKTWATVLWPSQPGVSDELCVTHFLLSVTNSCSKQSKGSTYVV